MASPIMSLQELLAKGCRPEEYGLKAAGLVEGSRHISADKKMWYVKVPGFYAVPVGADASAAKAAYLQLVNGAGEPRIVMARSSDPEERPGVFESHLSLYEPGNEEQGFRRWVEAAERAGQAGQGQSLASCCLQGLRILHMTLTGNMRVRYEIL